MSTAPNPQHRRASLVVLTDKGQQAFDRAMALKTPWMNRLASGIEVEDIEAMQRVLASLRAQLDTELCGADGA